MNFPDREVDEMMILGDFVLTKDDTENLRDVFRGSDDKELTSDNLRFFKVLKLPNNAERIERDGFVIEVGDEVISMSIGWPFSTENADYRMFELKYITCKLRR